MAPRLVPRTPLFDADSGGEEAVWRARAATLPEKAVPFAGVDLLDTDEKGELELLVAWPGRGIAVIEVKGGHITRREGTWGAGHVLDPHAAARERLQPLGSDRHVF
ncbi:hypothetical protein [Auraticoccus monumenti]|uniref:hypothetical protein n=1 Tax=Auraticoccus monumenti TaxID=675864 RepID=UPI0012F8FBF4|nr:hypothetical protein [Auraticoccus monumenti]